MHTTWGSWVGVAKRMTFSTSEIDDNGTIVYHANRVRA